MKKQVLTVALALGVFAVASAQDLTSKKGEKYLPEAGEWAIGFNAADFINNVGGLVSAKAATGATTAPYAQTIVGKMFKDEKTAYRGMLGLNFGSSTNNVLVNDVTSTATPPAQVKDVESVSQTSITLGAGLEMRKGSTRLQGYYGAMAMIMFGTSSSTYTYGNTLTATNTTHTNSFGQGAGVKENKAGSTFGLGIQGFIGAEYFVLPKISIGAEYQWGLSFNSTGDGSKTVETYTTSVQSTTTTTAGGSSFGIGAGTTSLMVNFHF